LAQAELVEQAAAGGLMAAIHPLARSQLPVVAVAVAGQLITRVVVAAVAVVAAGKMHLEAPAQPAKDLAVAYQTFRLAIAVVAVAAKASQAKTLSIQQIKP
jgi:hypothetical protein